MKKKFLIGLLVMIFAFALVGCSNADTQEDDKEKVQGEEIINSQDVLNELTQKLTLTAAWDAVVSYGQQEYSEFAVRNMPGQPVDEIAEDTSTWCLTAPCTVDGESMTCKAKVTGTTDNPEVISFEVY